MCLCEHCCAEFDRLYQALGVTLQERGESYYNNLMPEMVQELERKGEGTNRAMMTVAGCRMSLQQCITHTCTLANTTHTYTSKMLVASCTILVR